MRAVILAPLRPASGEVLVPSVIASDGSSTVITGSGAGIVGVGDRLADHDLVDAGDGDHLAWSDLVGRDPLQPLRHAQLGHLDAA